MRHLTQRKILLAVTGSIAAYKTALLVRQLITSGNEVRVIMTPAASDFITPLTLSTLSRNAVHSDISDGTAWHNHVELGLWADAMIVAPATANTMAKMAHGLADNLVLACYLSAKCPVFVAPAMDLDMWRHPSTVANVKTLRSYGNHIVPVGHGELASGLVGDGRMAEVDDIVDFMSRHLEQGDELSGKRVLITAGPTQEAIDPVRFIGNHSTGKMGIAVAEECAMRGADVLLILGPSIHSAQHPNVHTTRVTSADDMFAEALEAFPTSDISILTAAVADYKPANPSSEKIKKGEGDMNLALKRTPDIAQELGRIKRVDQVHIGFALETQNELEHALAKLQKKNFDFIVLNSLKDPGAGFQHDTNKVKIIMDAETVHTFELKSKKQVAVDIVNALAALILQKAVTT